MILAGIYLFVDYKLDNLFDQPSTETKVIESIPAMDHREMYLITEGDSLPWQLIDMHLLH